MSRDNEIRKVIILGSGPIVIGQAAEFDYSGTQACLAIKEEGIQTILVNSNPATIMTDFNIADKVYIEPLTVEILEKIIEKERPDGILAGFGGQTALNLAMELDQCGVLSKYNVKLLGINSDAIKNAEDRELFRKLMLDINEPIPESIIATTIDECLEFTKNHGYPAIIRPAYTLGGTGGGIATDEAELVKICEMGLKLSPIGQILLEQSVAGWKELEYEVIRDKKDNCIIICNMENIDPVGIHTGDSIVIAPSQTLRDQEHQMLRNAAIKIIRNLNIEGGCNIQFALNPKSNDFIVIEVNPRVSRSSALASKAVGYPIAKIAAKIAIGYTLDELSNYVTKSSSACFEPSIDYVVVKIPKWPFDKFDTAERVLGTQMKATGEVMAIDRSFEAAFIKALTSLDGNITGLRSSKLKKLSTDDLIAGIKRQEDDRILLVAEALRRDFTIDQIKEITQIDKWFLSGINNIVLCEKRLADQSIEIHDRINEAFNLGFTVKEMAILSKITEEEVLVILKELDAKLVYKMVDTCSGEFDAETPYYYSCHGEFDENCISDDKKIIVLGSGPIRIGQGVEFDYCCVHAAWGIREEGYKSIIINNNPETVSTDFDTADKLYFESLYIDNVMSIIENEKPEGVLVQFGGQTSLNLAEKLHAKGVKILGTSYEAIDLAEDRNKFTKLLESLEIPFPIGSAVSNLEEATSVAERIGYPVLVRPSYVIGGRAMQVVYDRQSLIKYMNSSKSLYKKHPLLIDKYVKGIEIEVDAISDGFDILIPGIMEHVERTGVHSGDSITMYPYQNLPEHIVDILVKYSTKIAKALQVIGLMNIQYVYDGEGVYVIEVNPRSSRTVPILSKVTNVPMVKLAISIINGKKLSELGYGTGMLKHGALNQKLLHAIKVPVFSNEKLANVDSYLGPEMRSTGEVMGVDEDFDKAVYKGFIASGIKVPDSGKIYVSLNKVITDEEYDIIRQYNELGFELLASRGTAKNLNGMGIKCSYIDIEYLIDHIQKENIQLIINTPTVGNNPQANGFKIRRKAAEFRIPVFTCLDSAKFFLKAIRVNRENQIVEPYAMNSYFSKV